MCQRAKEHAKGTLDYFGGFCDIGGTLNADLAREAAEETGLEVFSAKLQFTLPNKYPCTRRQNRQTTLLLGMVDPDFCQSEKA